MTTTLHHGDCLSILPTLDAESVDAVVTDPPYNVGKRYGDYADSMPVDDYLAWLREVYTEASRVSRDAVVFFPGTRHMFDVHDMLRGTGLRIVRPLGWHKKEFAGDLWSSGPAMAWEPIVWATKVEKPFWRKRFGHMGRDFLVIPSNRHSDIDHPCPKPLLVMRWLLGLFVPDGGTVLDPLCGSGTTGVAAVMDGFEFTGIDKNAEYVEIARRRIEHCAAQGRLAV